MKKIIIPLLLLSLLLLSSCSRNLPTFDEAKSKMEECGYEVSISVMSFDLLEQLGISQERKLVCEKDGEVLLEVYYFKNEEDAKKFYENYRITLESEIEVLRVNKYSIYRGTKNAINDLLK